MTKSAFVAIVGKPNVGKSSLLNLLVGEKIAIISDKPQTTRTRISQRFPVEGMPSTVLKEVMIISQPASTPAL